MKIRRSAGTDLASLQMRAISDGDDYIVNGQKMFSSGVDKADYHWLPKLMGTAGALEFLLSGKIVMGAEAKQLGLVSLVVPGEELMKVSQELAAQIAQYPLLALCLTKRLVYRGMLTDIDPQYDWEGWAGQFKM